MPLWLRIILQRQQQSIAAHSGGFFRLMQAVRHPPARNQRHPDAA